MKYYLFAMALTLVAGTQSFANETQGSGRVVMAQGYENTTFERDGQRYYHFGAQSAMRKVEALCKDPGETLTQVNCQDIPNEISSTIHMAVCSALCSDSI